MTAEAATGTSRGPITRVFRTSAIATALSFPITLGLLPIILGSVSVSVYGEWATLSAILSVTSLLEAGIPTEVARRVADANGRGDQVAVVRVVREAITVSLGFALILAAVGLLLSFFALPLVFPAASPNRLTTLRLVFLATIFLVGIGLLLAAWFAALGGLQRQDFGTYSNLLGTVGGAVATVAALELGAGIWGLFLGSLARTVIGWSGPVRGLRRLRPDIVPWPLRLSSDQVRGLLSSSSLLVFVTLAVLADNQFDKIALTRFAGSGAAGVFQIGTTLMLQARALAMLPSGPLLAGTAELHERDPEKLDRLDALVRQAVSSAGFTTLGAAALLAGPFVQLWLGPDYASVGHATTLLALAALPTMLTVHWYYYALGRGWQGVLALAALMALVLNLAATFALTPSLGVTGAAVGSAAGNVGAGLMMYALLRRRLSRPWLRGLWRPVAALAVAMGLFGALDLEDLHSWPGLLGVGACWVLTMGFLLLLFGAAPISLKLRLLPRPALSWSLR